jgi:hypothetical protein
MQTDAATLIEVVRRELAPVRDQLIAHPYVAKVERGELALTQLAPFAGEQHAIISSDLRSVAHLVGRCGPGFFMGVLEGERAALEALKSFASAVGMDERALDEYEPQPAAHAYAAYMAWLACYASAAEVAAAYLVNFEAWGTNCGRLSRALRGRYGLEESQVRFFDQFADAGGAAEFEREALAVIEAGLRCGVQPRQIRRAARLLQGYEALYWDSLLAGLE